MRKYFMLSAMFILFLNVSNSIAQNSTNTYQNQGDDWIQMNSTDGIIASFGIATMNGVHYLKIQLFNNSSELANVQWNLRQNDEILAGNSNHSINANSSIELFDASQLIEISGVESFENFTIETIRK